MNDQLMKTRPLLLSLLATYLCIIVLTAWVSDDAFITFRSIENFIHGYGLVYNVGERVQTFTHPLWMLLQSLVYALSRWGNPLFGLNRLFLGNLFISLSLSLITIILYSFRYAPSTKVAVLGLLTLILSKAFIDYSTSGLENPLSHFLAVCFFGSFLTGRKDTYPNAIGLSLLAGLATLNRLDVILLFLPALTLMVWQNPNRLKTTLAIIVGMVPVVLWEALSLFYYGTPFPNTALAKLNTGIQVFTLVKQGAYYFLNSLRLDSITLGVIAFSIVLALSSKKLRRIATAIGISLYLCYILYIGGDFMSGRYFSLPFLIAVILLSTFELKSLTLFGSSLAVILVIGLLPFVTTIERRPTYGENRENNVVFFDSHKIADERLVYADRTGLLIAIQGDSPKIVYSQEEWNYTSGYPKEVLVVGTMGLNGLRAGPDIHVLDKNGLADPLLARMPLEDTKRWRIGHFHHIIPDGYKETLSTGTNVIQDADIALYYDKLSDVIKGSLWDWDRLVEIWNLNTGKYDYLIEN